jgi:class 3 adenylate cyclase
VLTSKDILERTGISRATLNNYITSGLVPRPSVLAPGPDDGDAPRIGYFPDDTIERIETIQRLKREGWSIGRIVEHFAGPGPGTATPSDPREAAIPMPRPAASIEDAPGAPAMSPAAAPVAVAGRGPRGAPAITPVAILFSTLQDAPALWVKLSALEYFELVNEVWAELDRIFRRHAGLLGRHPDEGLVCYFLPQREGSHLWNALTAAREARATMGHLSRRWQQRKGWDLELCMNSGIDEGQDWMGTVGLAGQGDLRVLGEAAERAEQLSRCSRGGAILVTRNLLGKLSVDERRRLSFGVPRPGAVDADARLLLSFARLQDVAAAGATIPPNVANLAVTELLDFSPAAGGSGTGGSE